MPQLSSRSIRTFVLRQGRLTEGQQRSLDEHWQAFGIDTGGVLNTADDESDVIQRDLTPDPDRKLAPSGAARLDLREHFDDAEAPVWMEIGIGNGDALVHMAEHNRSVNFLGVEVHLPGVGHALGEIANRELTNVRLIRYDVVDLIEHFLAPRSIDRVLIYFPDPWHKTRHHKRRLVNANFLNMLETLLRSDGAFHFASDWVPYARQVRSLVQMHPHFECLPDGDEALSISSLRPETHFERRGLRLGHEVTDLVIRKVPH